MENYILWAVFAGDTTKVVLFIHTFSSFGENGISFVVRKGAPAGIVLPIYVHSSGGEEGNVYASALKKRPLIFLIHLNKKIRSKPCYEGENLV